MEYILVDTGLWIAAFDERDANFEAAQEKLELIEPFQLVIPWPVMFETLRTRFVRRRLALERFEARLKGPRVSFVDDGPFREAALDLSLESSLRRSRPLSMVDCLIRLLLDDTNTRIDYLATFNHPDFADVCRRRSVEIV